MKIKNEIFKNEIFKNEIFKNNEEYMNLEIKYI